MQYTGLEIEVIILNNIDILTASSGDSSSTDIGGGTEENPSIGDGII